MTTFFINWVIVVKCQVDNISIVSISKNKINSKINNQNWRKMQNRHPNTHKLYINTPFPGLEKALQ